MAPVVGLSGRPVPRPLETEVLEKFKRHDSRYIKARQEMYPQFVKDVPGPGAEGKGSVNWIGLNPDPCKAKYIAKNGSVKPARPISAPIVGRVQSAGSLGTQVKKPRPSSVPSGGRVKSAGSLGVDVNLGSSCKNREEVDGKRTRPSSVPSSGRVQSTGLLGTQACPEPDGNNHEVDAKKPRPSSVPPGGRWGARPVKLPRISSHQHFLEQKMKLPGALDPKIFEKKLPGEATSSVGAELRDMIYLGVSHEEEGRRAYLKERAKIMPQERYLRSGPITTSATCGWEYALGKASRCLRPVRSSAAACIVPC